MSGSSTRSSSTIPPDELAERQRIGAKYEASKELAKVQDAIRGHRLAVNTLIKEERRLMAREEELNLVMREAANDRHKLGE